MIDPTKFVLQIVGHHDIIVLVLAKVELDGVVEEPTCQSPEVLE